MKFTPRKRSRRWLIAGVLVLIALPLGYYLARHQAWPAYKNYRERKLARMTQEFMAAGDNDNALLTARQALRDNQRSLPHWKLAAAAAKAKGTPEVIYYQRNVALYDKSVESKLELIRLALQHGAYRDALDTIENMDAAARQNAEFHRLAAQTYLAMGRAVAAKTHLYSLLSLQPEDHTARLDLAEIGLAEDSAGKNRALRDDIAKLAEQPELRVRALEMLVKDALATNDAARAVTLADQLATDPRLTGLQKVLVLYGLTKGAPERAAIYRQQLQTEFASEPRAAVALIGYYRKTGLPVEARRWFDSLPATTREDVGVREAIAAAFLEWKDWLRLDQAIAGSPWKEREFMRQAFIAFSARKNARFADSGNAWRLAVIQAGESVRSTSELLALVGQWGWQTEQYDLVWKLFALMPRNEAISRQLIAWEHHQGRTANLNRIYARLAEFSPDDRMTRNNFAYSSLLLDGNLSKAFEIARLNHQAEPANPFFATTQALALYKQNKPAEALAVLETIRPAALSVPERTMYRALFRASSGDALGAADLLSGLQSKGFLPEERRLIEKTKVEIARLDEQKGEDLRLYALDHRGEIDRSKGWLKVLPEALRAQATVEMQTTDSLFAMGDLRGLGAQLRKGAWYEHEHLRLALIAYVSRERHDDSSARSYWRTAMGSATGDPKKLRELEALVSLWDWSSEKIETLSKLYEIDPGDRAAFVELMEYYRASGRTADLVAVLSAYLSTHPNDQTQQSGLAYYSMLSGLNVARAYVTAQETYRASPDDPLRRLVYAFALWKQRRPQEAWDLLDEITADQRELVPAALLRAAVLADMERRDDAAEALKTFDATKALPEETRLAAVVASKLREDPRVSGLN